MTREWPYLEDDFMEIGNTGWVPVGESVYFNKHNLHTMDELGKDYDENGVLIYDPEKEKDNEEE